jgi:hypothetical protein
MDCDIIVVPQVFVEGQHVGVSNCKAQNWGSCELLLLRDQNE